jgi:hypothetical protein
MYARTAVAVLALLTSAASGLPAQAYEESPAAIDSLRAWYALGLYALPAEDGDSILADTFISYLHPGDTVWTRRWALYGRSWLLAQASFRRFRRAAVIFLWPENIPDSAPPGPRPSSWSLLFARDSLGCWFIVNDTTPASTCARRDDPTNAVPRPDR